MNFPLDVEELLRDGLRREADSTDHEPTPLARVEWNARKLRRASRARKGGVALVAAAAAPIALQTGALVAERPDHGEPDPSLFAALPAGEAPDVDWIEGSVYHGDSGFDAAVSVPDVEAFVPYRGGLLLTTADRVVVLDDHGSVVSDECGSPSIGQDEVGETVVTSYVHACNDRAEGVTLHWSSVTGSADLPKNLTPNGMSVEPVAVRGDGTFITGTDLRTGEERAYHLATALGPLEEVPGIASVVDVTGDGRWLLGVTADSSTVVARAETGEVRTRFEGTPLGFNRDGTRVAVASERFGLQVFDAGTGELLGMTGRSVVPQHVAWESGGTVLALTQEDGQEAIVRFSVDDGLSLAAGPAAPGTLALVDQP